MVAAPNVAPPQDRAREPPRFRQAGPRSTGTARAARRGRLAAYAFLAPAFALFVIVLLIPIGKATQVSFYDWLPFPGADNTWVGLDNYTRALGDPQFRLSVVNALVYMLVTVPGQILLGLGVALLLQNRLPGRAAFRVLFYLPVVTSWVVVSLLFRYLFATDGGLINWVLVEGLGVVEEPVGWLESRWTGIAALCVLGIWKGVGWTAVILLAGMTGVPKELHEAAAVDGAGYGRRTWHVTLPALRRTLLFVSVMLVIGSFNVFISVLLMTAGGPAGKTEMPLTYTYRQAFNFLEFGYGSAVAVIMTVIVLILSIGQTLLVNRAERGE
jgi:multiple sugar transport system permease protein